MKKVACLILAILAVMSLCACGQGEENQPGNSAPAGESVAATDSQTGASEPSELIPEPSSGESGIDFSQPIFQMLLGKWKIYPEEKGMENVSQELEFRKDYTCSLDGKEYTWKLSDWYGLDPMGGDRIDIDIYDGEAFLMRRSVYLAADGIAELSDLGAQPHYSKADGNSQPEKSISEILKFGTEWYYNGHIGWEIFQEDGQLKDGGTWTYDGNKLSVAHPDKTREYEIVFCKDIPNGGYMLIAQDRVMSTYPGLDKVLPLKTVEITLDNWQEYFEFAVVTKEEKVEDVFGETTGETEKTEQSFWKLKDEYYSRIVSEKSELALRYTLGRSQSETKLDGADYDSTVEILYFGLPNIKNDPAKPFEMVKIQGTLTFLDVK